MKVKIQAIAAVLTPEEIKTAVPPQVLAEIKKKDPSPRLQAYSIAQEGISRPRIIGEGITPIQWPRKAINAIGQVVRKGIQFFRGHNADSSTDGRRSVAEVVGHFAKEIKGKLNQIVIGYFPDKKEADECDVCSIEADIDLLKDGVNTIAGAVHKITAIALGNSKDETPAFAGAVRLGSIQAFEEPDDDETNKNKKPVGDTMPTFEEVKQYIKDNNVWPNQLYNEDVMKNDNTFGKIYEDFSNLEKASKDFETKLNKSIEDNATIKKNAEKIGAKTRLEKLYPEGATDKQKEFLNKRFNPDKIEDLSDDGLKKFVDNGLEEFKEFAGIFGDKDANTPPIPPKTPEEPTEEDEIQTDVNTVVNDIVSDEKPE